MSKLFNRLCIVGILQLSFLVEQLEITKKLLFILYLFIIFCACLKKGSWFWSVARHMNDGLFLINGIVNCHCSFRVYSLIYTRNTRIETYYVLVRSILTNSRNIENWWIPYTHGKAVYISWLNRVRWNIKKIDFYEQIYVMLSHQ